MKFLSEIKASSLKIGDSFKLSSNLGKFRKDEQIKLIDILQGSDDIEIILSNGITQDNFFLDPNESI